MNISFILQRNLDLQIRKNNLIADKRDEEHQIYQPREDEMALRGHSEGPKSGQNNDKNQDYEVSLRRRKERARASRRVEEVEGSHKSQRGDEYVRSPSVDTPADYVDRTASLGRRAVQGKLLAFDNFTKKT